MKRTQHWRSAIARSAMCMSFVSFVLSAAGSQQVPVFRTGVDLVNAGVIVIDKKGTLVTDLTADDFEIDEDGKKQTVKFFARGDSCERGTGVPLMTQGLLSPCSPVPLHLGVLIDVSGSMGEDMSFTKTAAIKFLNTLPDAADLTVVDFDTEVRTARYSQNEFARLVERIRQKKATGFTALYDAIGTYLDGASGQDGRTIMLLYTDGGDTRSSISRSELMDLLKASDVTVYAIGALEHQSASTKHEQRMVLQQIAETTGGQAFFPFAVKQLDEIYEKIVAQIRAQYTIGYLSTNEKTDGSWRKVEITIARKDGRDLRVHARKGYFARYKKD